MSTGGRAMAAHWVDLVIVVILLLAALRGWRTGAIRQVLWFGGLAVGLVVGVALAPVVARHLAPGSSALVSLGIVLVATALCAALGQYAGVRVAAGARRIRLGPLDDALGVFVAVVAMALVVWFVGTLAAASRSATLDRGLRNSAILQRLSASLPTVPSVFARIEADLAQQGVPIVFATLPPQLLPPVAQPSDAAVRAAELAAGPSTVRIEGPACNAIVAGSGFVAAPGVVVTNAHVVAGDRSPRVTAGSGTYAATTIGFDPQLDVAVLRAPGLPAPPLTVTTAVADRGTKATALGYPGGGPLVAVPASVDGLFLATGLDISGGSLVSRSVYQLHAVIRPGNSGGPLVAMVNAHPVVIGLVFARSTSDSAVGYALAMGPVWSDVHTALRNGRTVTPGGCAS
jgi:S1-C subfamily serine protease